MTAGRRAGRIVLTVALLFALFAAGFVYGDYAAKHRIFPYPHISGLAGTARPDLRPQARGRWRVASGRSERKGITREQEEELVSMMTLGYVSGSKPATSLGGVTLFDRARAYGGLNLFSSGHGPEAVLMDMEGRALHTWGLRLTEVWPDRQWLVKDPEVQPWRRVHLYDNGDLLAVYDWLGMIRIDRDSRVVWARPAGAHHDIDVQPDGTIYTLEHERGILPRIDESYPTVEDYVAVLSADGTLLRRVSLLEALERSPYWALLERALPRGDILHTNSIEVLDGRLERLSPAFAPGNVLVSFRELDAIAVVDLDEEVVVWALTGRWHRQHEATVLGNGHMMLFNNEAGDGASEVLEFDPLTQRTFWSVRGDSTDPFHSPSCGAGRRLPNGNTLITESDNGRAFEVTADGTIVWEFLNPQRAGEDHELIATLYEVVRLRPNFPLDWLPEHDRSEGKVAHP